MKNLMILLSVLLCNVNLFSQEDMDALFEVMDEDPEMKGSTLLLMNGQELVYGVDFFGKQYDFIIKMTSFDDGWDMNYEMTNEEGTKGTIHISKDALESAHAQNNYFQGGPLNLEDQTTIWVSKAVYKELRDDKTSSISADGGTTFHDVSNNKYGYDYSAKVKGKKIDDIGYLYATNDDGSVKYWIHLSESNPLILKMDLGWKIWLKEIR